MRIAVIGAGITGRLAALASRRAGHDVVLVERSAADDRRGASQVAAGMIAPLTEAAHFAPGDRWLYALGRDSLKRWQHLIPSLMSRVDLVDGGTVIAARRDDAAEIVDIADRLARVSPDADIVPLDHAAMAALEPDLGEAAHTGLLIRGEGAIDAVQALAALAATLVGEGGQIQWSTLVERVAPHRVELTSGGQKSVIEADMVIDARGLGARDDMPSLRGIRGELVELYAPDVQISRPIRISHGRHPIYIVPKGAGRYVVGATMIESESDAPASVTSALELLSTVYAVHAGFRHAAITQFPVGVRPAFFDHAPKVMVGAGLARINGLYRHGFLFGPALADALMSRIESASNDEYPQLFCVAEDA